MFVTSGALSEAQTHLFHSGKLFWGWWEAVALRSDATRCLDSRPLLGVFPPLC